MIFINICNPLYLIVLFTVLIDVVAVIQSADGSAGVSRFLIVLLIVNNDRVSPNYVPIIQMVLWKVKYAP